MLMKLQQGYYKMQLIFIFFTLILLFNIKVLAQIENYKAFKITQIDSIINATTSAKKNKWLNIIPSPGYSIRSGLSLSFNLNTLSQYYQSVQANKIEIERLRHQMYNQLDNELVQLENALAILNSDIELYKMEVELFKNEENIFKIEKGRYENHKTTILDWLKYKGSYEAKKLTLLSKKKQIINRINTITYKIKNPVLGSGLLLSLN